MASPGLHRTWRQRRVRAIVVDSEQDVNDPRRSNGCRAQRTRESATRHVTIRVLIAVEVRLYREGLSAALGEADGIEIVGTAGDSAQALATARESAPDVILLDPSMPDILATIAELTRPPARAKVIALAVADSESDVVAWAEAGLSGFVGRERSLGELVETIRTVYDGELVCSPRTAGALLRRVTSLAQGRLAVGQKTQLTTREREVAGLIDEGLSNKQIAARLHIELPTVKHHVHHILEKLGVARRSEAVARLRQRGLPQS
jgi:two-component system nitrate/nitrite response regulator NarL